MNAELIKVLDIFEVIESYPGKPFASLTTQEKLELSTSVRRISLDSDYNGIVESILAIYKDIDSKISGISIGQAMQLAAKVIINEIGCDVSIDAIIEAVDAVEATETLTIGGETDSDIAVGDIIKVWEIQITAVANDATPGLFEFCIDDDKDTVIENIIACIDAIPGNTGFPFTAEAGTSPTIIFTAKEAGTNGNDIAVSITTDGETAFVGDSFADGADEIKGTAGRVGSVLVDEDDNVYVMTKAGYKPVTLTAEGA